MGYGKRNGVKRGGHEEYGEWDFELSWFWGVFGDEVVGDEMFGDESVRVWECGSVSDLRRGVGWMGMGMRMEMGMRSKRGVKKKRIREEKRREWRIYLGWHRVGQVVVAVAVGDGGGGNIFLEPWQGGFGCGMVW
ncbi:hypothetical protein ACMFMG_004122 [Clarireedia jacksonii]